MQDIGTVALILLFAVGFVMYVGSNGQYGIGFLELYNQVGTMDLKSIVNLIVSALSSSISIGTMVIATLFALTNSRSAAYIAGITILIAVAQIFFLPFTFYKEVPFPNEIMMLTRGFFNLLLLLAVIGFVSEKRW